MKCHIRHLLYLLYGKHSHQASSHSSPLSRRKKMHNLIQINTPLYKGECLNREGLLLESHLIPFQSVLASGM